MNRSRKELVIHEKKPNVKGEKSSGVEARVKPLRDNLERATMFFEKYEDTCTVSKLHCLAMHNCKVSKLQYLTMHFSTD